MKFENTAPDGSSYQKPKPGKYLGVVIGFAYVGTQPAGTYKATPKVMVRWELHKVKGPSLDESGYIHTSSQTYGATVRGDKSNFRKVVEAHGIPVPEGGSFDSHSLLGKCAWLNLEESDDKKYVNVMNVTKLDPEDDTAPTPVTQVFSHWEPSDEGLCPDWAGWAVGRSLDLAHRAPADKRKDTLDETGKRKQLAGAGVATATAGGDDATGDDIPF